MSITNIMPLHVAGEGITRNLSIDITFGKLKQYIVEGVTELAIQKRGVIWVQRRSIWKPYEDPNITEKFVTDFLAQVGARTKQDADQKNPILSATFSGNYRAQWVLPPAAVDFPSLTIRIPNNSIRKLSEYEEQGFFNDVIYDKAGLAAEDVELEALLKAGKTKDFLAKAVEYKKTIVLSGATGSGKTEFMKSLVSLIPTNERLITIEDSHELSLIQPNVVNLLYSRGKQGVADVSAKSLLESCLRMKPDRIILAEIRGEECLYFLRGAASGHPGSMTSVHAGTPAMAFEQMAIMIQDSQGGKNLQFNTIKRLLKLTIDVIVQVTAHDGIRRISEIHYKPKEKLEAVDA